MKTKNMHWIVFEHDFNKNKIVHYDIFSHYGFAEDVKKADKKFERDAEFLDEVERSLQYYFWAKAEHEILIKGLFDKNDESQVKIDVFEQVEMNWERFAEYLLANRKTEKLIKQMINK